MCEELSISEPLSLEFSSDASDCRTGFRQSVHAEFVCFLLSKWLQVGAFVFMLRRGLMAESWLPPPGSKRCLRPHP